MEINTIGHESTGKVMGPTIPIGSKVTLKNWPVGGKVIGHHDGHPIIQPEPCSLSVDAIESYTDEMGCTRYPFFQRFAD
jgi:hypothetical protein